MNKIIQTFTLAICVLILGACASKGFNRGELQSQIGVTKPVYDDQEIKDAYNKKSNLPKPFKVAVYFKKPTSLRGEPVEWRWSEQDKAMLEEIGKDLKSKGLVSEVFPLISSVVDDENLRALRLVAAQHKADALLVVGGAGQVDRYINKWGWSYILLVPALVVPGSEADTLFMTNATLWDVKNEFLYMTAESEASTSDTHVAAFGKSDKDLFEDAKKQSLAKLKDEISKQIQGTKL